MGPRKAMSCGQKCSRIALVTLNIVFLVCGVAFVVLGGLFRFGSDKMKKDVEATLSEIEIGDYNLYDLSTNLAIIFMVAGGVMILFSAMGFIGACCMSKCALVLYAILVGACFCLEVAGVVMFFIMRSKLEDGIQTGLEKSIGIANDPNAEADIRQAQQASLEYLFKEFECCRVNNATLDDTDRVPNCHMPTTEEYHKDCYEALKEWIEQYQVAFIAIGISVLVVELLLIACTCTVYRATGRGRYN